MAHVADRTRAFDTSSIHAQPRDTSAYGPASPADLDLISRPMKAFDAMGSAGALQAAESFGSTTALNAYERAGYSPALNKTVDTVASAAGLTAAQEFGHAAATAGPDGVATASSLRRSFDRFGPAAVKPAADYFGLNAATPSPATTAYERTAYSPTLNKTIDSLASTAGLATERAFGLGAAAGPYGVATGAAMKKAIDRFGATRGHLATDRFGPHAAITAYERAVHSSALNNAIDTLASASGLTAARAFGPPAVKPAADYFGLNAATPSPATTAYERTAYSPTLNKTIDSLASTAGLATERAFGPGAAVGPYGAATGAALKKAIDVFGATPGRLGTDRFSSSAAMAAYDRTTYSPTLSKTIDSLAVRAGLTAAKAFGPAAAAGPYGVPTGAALKKAIDMFGSKAVRDVADSRPNAFGPSAAMAAFERTAYSPALNETIDTLGSSAALNAAKAFGPTAATYGVATDLLLMKGIEPLGATLAAIQLAAFDPPGGSAAGAEMAEPAPGLAIPTADESIALLSWLRWRRPTYAQAAYVCHVIAVLHAVAMLVEYETGVELGPSVVGAELFSGVFVALVGLVLHGLEQRSRRDVSD
jgi:hypothetical protein